ncbi:MULTISPECIES: NAD(P)/FAD-dependent oxidoreductase [unclassified Herbaspirillum]|uniref:NAD(P)/FAD-dependent oxidoreductase n=1 Tax=unclassified Herbaspirillum TaxID=2624150 RepID=UPI00114EC006|nr:MULTISPECIES: NAD(P)/FAD-dependent oxidoreductase [unclassified Herbaspirillum]MBB5393885.1 putative flavoprotein involved in K+ transport [Herbaspirillum sp. SJZ102]TQK00077.1 putative flavoprotein involved in K+ transport [Herbaspirillum sp. SJZ130]TQK04598.1 putative flavoprotein involved in K+ transport [Herbaspirillum sp. SJZ106]
MSKTNPDQAVAGMLETLQSHLRNGKAEAAAGLFLEDCYWRDLVAFTWNIKTLEGRAQIAAMLAQQLPALGEIGLRLAEGEAASQADGVTQAWITVETGTARGSGLIRLKDGKIWTLLTTMSELKGHEESKGVRRPMGAVHGVHTGRKSWKEEREQELAELGRSEQPYCLIIGGGQGGLALGARLRQLKVPTIIVERNEKPGDSWRKRYKSLCLHDPVWYDHMPYIPFPDNWPVFTPKDKVGDWLEMYAKVMELNFWGSTDCKSASYDEAAGEWRVVVERGGERITLRPKQLVLATGMSGKPNLPKFKGMDVFKGEQQHSSKHPGPDAYRGKKVVVIGANNSAHDICAALWEAGVDVTMVQRSSTHIVKSDSLMELALGDLYSERALQSGMTTAKADLTFASIPYKVLPQMQTKVFDAIRERDAGFYARLEKAGFMLDFGDDGSGLFMKYLRRGSGYYIDVGASELVADGKIKLKSGVDVKELKEHSVVLSDGSELPADLVVYATGYGSMNGWAADLISQEVADKVGKVWGLGSDTLKDPGPWEGEQRNMWKPTQQPALWFHGGNLHQSRHYSQYLSLQLKARMEVIATPVYGLQEVHHLS